MRSKVESSSKTTKSKLSEKKQINKFVANLPRVAVAKNSSMVSKNSSYSDKRYESTKVDDKDPSSKSCDFYV